MPRKPRKKFTAEERRKSEHWRNNVFDFMKRFNAQCLWEIDGPEMTDVDWIMCFAFDGGVVLIQTWCAGGWSIYTPFDDDGEYDKTEQNIRERIAVQKSGGRSNQWINPARVAPLLLIATEKLLVEVDSEIEQRKHSGNDEDWAQLEQLSTNAHAVVKMAKDGPLGETKRLPYSSELLKAAGIVDPVIDDTDYKALFFKARDLLNDNAAAWGDEEDSVREEHAELIEATDTWLDNVANKIMTDEEKSEQYWASNTGHDAEGKPLGGVDAD